MSDPERAHKWRMRMQSESYGRAAMALADIENAALTAERDALQAAVDRVKALADNWVCDCDRGPEGQHRAYCSAFDADNVRAALAGAPAEQRKANDG